MSKYTETIPSNIQASLKWMLDYIKPNTTLLDVGCSTGYFGEFIKKEKNCIVDGIEISEDKIEAKKRLDKVYSFDIETNWPKNILKKKYDYIFFGDILEHLKDPGATLRNAKKILSKNGLIFISIPNIAHISTRLELMQGSFQYEDTGILDNTHLQYFTLSTFTRLAQDSGYKVIKVDYSVNDFQKQVIEKLLDVCGLKPTAKFWRLVNSIEARAYQYKFILRQNNIQIKNTRAEFASLPKKPEHFRDDFIKDLQQQISNINNHAKEQAKIISNQNDIINKQKNEIIKLDSGLHKLKRNIKNKVLITKNRIINSTRKK